MESSLVALPGIAVIAAVLLAILAAAFIVGLLILGLGLVFRVLGIVIRATLAVVGVVLGAAVDLLISVLSVIAMLLNAGFALALVVFGRWERAETRAARIQSRLDLIGGRLSRAAWHRPVSLAKWVVRGPAPQRVEPIAAARVDGMPMWTPPPPIADSPKASRTIPPSERDAAMLVHLSALAGLLLPGANVLGPLVVWLARKDSMPSVDEQGREAINFNITVCLVTVVSLVLFVLTPVVLVAWIILISVAATRVHGGRPYRYPLCLRLIPPTRSKVTAEATPPIAGGSSADFAGYEVVGSLPSGGSGARLHVAVPPATVARRLPEGIDRVVIKTFALSEGSTLPQIVRESRAMDAATRLGLVLEHRLEPGRFWYAMPFYPGAHFGDAVRSLHAMGPADGLDAASLRKVLAWTAGLASTLDRYHRAGLWHKDVKPENVIVAGGEARLVDIGLVTSLSSGMTLTTHGTEYFRDPEMVRLALRGVKVHEVDGARFDLYGVGAMLYLALEDTFPAHGGLSGFTKRSPESLRWIVRRAMCDYAKRYPDAATMLADLHAVLAAEDPWSVTPAMLPSFSRPDGRAAGSAAPPRETGVVGVASPPASLAAKPVVVVETARGTRPRWGLTSPGAKRGAGRLLAAMVLFAIGLIVAMVFVAIVEGTRRTADDQRAIVVLDSGGDLSGLFAGGAVSDSLAALVGSTPEAIRLATPPPALLPRLQASARGLGSDPVATLRRAMLEPVSRESFDLDGVIFLDREQDRIVSVFSRDGVVASWLDGALQFSTESGKTWIGEVVPLESILPAAPGSRVLVLRDPTATATLSRGELALWERLGIELVEPAAEDAAELAVWLAGDRTGPEVQAQVEAALERYDAVELCRIRDPEPISRLAAPPGIVMVGTLN